MSNVLYQHLPWETVSNILGNHIHLANSVMLTRDWITRGLQRQLDVRWFAVNVLSHPAVQCRHVIVHFCEKRSGGAFMGVFS